MTVGTPLLINHPDMDEQATGSYIAALWTSYLIRLEGTGAVVTVSKDYVEELGHKGRSWQG